MCKGKPKILNHRIGKEKITECFLHIKVYRNEERDFTAVHLF